MIEIKLAKASHRKIQECAKTKSVTVDQAVCEGLEEWWDLLGITVSPEESSSR